MFVTYCSIHTIGMCTQLPLVVGNVHLVGLLTMNLVHHSWIVSNRGRKGKVNEGRREGGG